MVSNRSDVSRNIVSARVTEKISTENRPIGTFPSSYRGTSRLQFLGRLHTSLAYLRPPSLAFSKRARVIPMIRTLTTDFLLSLESVHHISRNVTSPGRSVLVSGRSRTQYQTRQYRGPGQKCTRTSEKLVFRSQSLRHWRSHCLYNDLVSWFCILVHAGLANSSGLGHCSAM
jgi:hypothetical protein